MDQPDSLFDHFFTKDRSRWVTLIVSLFLLIMPFAAALIDGDLENILRTGNWRIYLLAPTIIAYIWLVSPPMARTGDQVIDAIKQLVRPDSVDFDQIFQEASRIHPAHEWLWIS